jgi:DDE superfamily endonuclease
MFYGLSKQDKDCDNFNYFASQCCIRIEMAFGLMQMKWGILWRPLKVNLGNIKYIMLAIARLHNFTINVCKEKKKKKE